MKGTSPIFSSSSKVNESEPFHERTLLCKCGVPAKLVTSGTHANPGRLFYGCRYWPDDEGKCDYFIWYDKVSASTGPYGKVSSSTGPHGKVSSSTGPHEHVTSSSTRPHEHVTSVNLMKKTDKLKYTIGVLQNDIETIKCMRDNDAKKIELVEINVIELLRGRNSDSMVQMLLHDRERIARLETLLEKIRLGNDSSQKKLDY